MSNPTDPTPPPAPDLDEIERLAKTMRPGPYIVERKGYDYRVLAPDSVDGDDLIADAMHYNEAAYFAALNPATVLAMVERLRKAEAERDALAEQVRGLRESQRWLTVAERVPPVDREVLVYDPAYDPGYRVYMAVYFRDGRWFVEDAWESATVTRWMPLPPEPNAAPAPAAQPKDGE